MSTRRCCSGLKGRNEHTRFAGSHKQAARFRLGASAISVTEIAGERAGGRVSGWPGGHTRAPAGGGGNPQKFFYRSPPPPPALFFPPPPQKNFHFLPPPPPPPLSP